MISVPTFSEPSGVLGVMDFSSLPFVPQRFFWLFDVERNAIRANHAHRRCHQFIVCQRGNVKARITSGSRQVANHELGSGSGLHLPPLNWLELFDFSQGAVLGVFASEPYDQSEYIRHRAELYRIYESSL